MGFQLNSQPSTIIESQVISATTSTKKFCIGEYEGSFSLQAIWTAGSSVNMSLVVEFSLDGVNWATDSSSARAISASSGNELWDFWQGSGAEFIRITFTVTGGSATFKVLTSGRSRH